MAWLELFPAATASSSPGLRLEQMRRRRRLPGTCLLAATSARLTWRERRKMSLTLQDVLAARGSRGPSAFVGRCLLRVFRHPRKSRHMGFRFEGHHLRRNAIAVRDGRIICEMTPSSFLTPIPDQIANRESMQGLQITLKAERGAGTPAVRRSLPGLQGRPRAVRRRPEQRH